MSEADDLWRMCRPKIMDRITESSWLALFETVVPSRLAGNRLFLDVPSSIAKARIEQRHLGQINEVLRELGFDDTEVVLGVSASSSPRNGATASADSFEADEQQLFTPAPRPDRQRQSRTSVEERGMINPSFSFDAFVIGSSNRFAHAAALSVAETPARSYNPLFIHGKAGLGKTHLLHAIGNYALDNYPELKVRYVSTETFLNEFVDAIRKNNTAAFKRRYRECDILLIDDVQFLEARESLQEEFFHTFNHLHAARKQMVLTSDRPPKAIATLEERLRSRFMSGLITDVQPPEVETRLAILRKKSEMMVTPLPDEVLQFIAQAIKDNIRELEGALIRVSAYASLNGLSITTELARELLADMVDIYVKAITPDEIIETISAYYGLTPLEIQGASRKRPLVEARQVAMYVFRELTDLSFPAIGKEFGNRDHTTVMHAVNKVEAKMGEDRETYNRVTALLTKIRSQQL
ncbi:MAG: chromosomal replication initiator protein DnaA [Actinomycetota bacterium]|nr:chromosomal replication initiator protein DnaA [Actinomycetota bacterium]